MGVGEYGSIHKCTRYMKQKKTKEKKKKEKTEMKTCTEQSRDNQTVEAALGCNMKRDRR